MSFFDFYLISSWSAAFGWLVAAVYFENRKETPAKPESSQAPQTPLIPTNFSRTVAAD